MRFTSLSAALLLTLPGKENALGLSSENYFRELSGRRVRHVHTTLSYALTQAVKWQMLPQNPAKMVELPKRRIKEMKALSPAEVTRFLEAAQSDRYAVLFTFAIGTGMRVGEYLAVQWKDVDFERHTVTVQRALIWPKVGTQWYFGTPKTPRSRRTIPLPPSLTRALIEHKRKQAEERLKAGADYRNLDLIFCTAEGGPLDPDNLRERHFKAVLRRAELSEEFRMYDLCHTCATLLLAAGENPKVVSERLGHASIVLTLDTYSHVLPDMQRAASEKLEKMMFG